MAGQPHCWHPTTGSPPASASGWRQSPTRSSWISPPGQPGGYRPTSHFLAAGLERKVAFEITDPLVMARLVTEGLCVALLASTYAVRLPGVIVMPVVNTSHRIEHLIWSRLGPTPAAAAFIARLRPRS